MALITCSDCGTQVSDLAPACVKCGRPLRAQPLQPAAHVPKPFLQQNVGCGTVLMVFVVLMILANVSRECSDATAPPPDPKAAAAREEREHQEAQARLAAAERQRQDRRSRCAGLDHATFDETLLHRSDGSDFFVTDLWYSLQLEKKQATARYLSMCRADGNSIRVLDSRTGKPLAKFSESWGYSNYEG